ncbi:transporter [Sphingomonas bacterium]|uniref:transporter n=1 Tax=Sphingomonas bacterium TaxID=1895847 RepID=UPI001576DCAE|nr:transporter [Sphingomonas bacterium]
MKLVLALVATLSLPLTAGSAQAQSSAPDATAPAPICTDRPTKANAACTVPAGVVQLETDLGNWTRNTDGGVRTDVVLYTNPYLKLGVGPHTDVEANIAPYVTARASAGGSHDTIGGVGDLYLRVKQRLSPSDSKVQIAVLPFVKAPTARLGIGNRRWEGGVAAPVVFSLPQGFTLNFGPEVDLLADGDRHGRHAQLVGIANLAKSAGKATIYAEFYSAQNYDPAGTVHQYSADTAIAYLLSPTLQIDVGGNFGLNRFTPDAQVYFGLSTKF